MSTTVPVSVRTIGALTGCAEEADVEADVVADDHRVADEVDQRSEHRFDAGRVGHEHVGQAGEHRDLRGDRPPRIHEGLEGSEELAATHLDRTDLGDHVVVAVAAGGLEVDDAERHIVQRRAEVVERPLVREVGDRTDGHRGM